MIIEMCYIMYMSNTKLGISLIDYLIVKIKNYIYLIQVMKFILNGKLIILLDKHMENNIIDKIKFFIESARSNPYTHRIKMLDHNLDVQVHKEIY